MRPGDVHAPGGRACARGTCTCPGGRACAAQRRRRWRLRPKPERAGLPAARDSEVTRKGRAARWAARASAPRGRDAAKATPEYDTATAAPAGPSGPGGPLSVPSPAARHVTAHGPSWSRALGPRSAPSPSSICGPARQGLPPGLIPTSAGAGPGTGPTTSESTPPAHATRATRPVTYLSSSVPEERRAGGHGSAGPPEMAEAVCRVCAAVCCEATATHAPLGSLGFH